jgi:hypothetical protein
MLSSLVMPCGTVVHLPRTSCRPWLIITRESAKGEVVHCWQAWYSMNVACVRCVYTFVFCYSGVHTLDCTIPNAPSDSDKNATAASVHDFYVLPH